MRNIIKVSNEQQKEIERCFEVSVDKDGVFRLFIIMDRHTRWVVSVEENCISVNPAIVNALRTGCSDKYELYWESVGITKVSNGS